MNYNLACQLTLGCSSSTVPQVSSKPSPSKRRCSEENIEPVVNEGCHHPVGLPDPPTDKKPPLGPSSVQSSSSLERASLPADAQQQQEEMVVSAAAKLPAKTAPVEEEPTPPVAGMRSRLQRLAEQRKCWDKGRNWSWSSSC